MLGPWTKYSPLCIGPYIGKSFLNKLVFKFDTVENRFSLMCLYMVIYITPEAICFYFYNF